MKKRQFLFLCTAMIFLLVVGCSNKELSGEPVRPTITLDQRHIEYGLGPYCWFGTKKDGICGDPPPPDIFYKGIKEKAVVADPGGVISVKFPIEPDEFTLSIVNTYGVVESIKKPNDYSYNLPKKPGYYKYRLSAVWEVKNEASYLVFK